MAMAQDARKQGDGQYRAASARSASRAGCDAETPRGYQMVDAWTTAEVEPVLAAILLKRGQSRKPMAMPSSPRGTLPDGLADFRGFPLAEVTLVSITQANLSGARAPKNQFGVQQFIRLTDVTAEQSVFDRAGKFGSLKGKFEACSFRKITATSANIAGTFTDCDFSGANFKQAHFNGRFIRCRFQLCNLHLASWPSSFQDCEFAGAGIHELFADVRASAFAGDRVTFTVTMNRVYPGEFR